MPPAAELELMSGVIRLYASPDHSYDDYYCVLTITATGPGVCTIFALHATRVLRKSDVHAIKTTLLAAGYIKARGWRKQGRRVPFGGRVLQAYDGMALWEVELTATANSALTII